MKNEDSSHAFHCHCWKCGYEWIRRFHDKPKVCTRCKSEDWEVEPDSSRLYTVYAIVRKKDWRVIYIGVSYALRQRMFHHSSAFKKTWKKLSVVALATTRKQVQASEFERFAIIVFQNLGQCDLNPPIPKTVHYETWPTTAIKVANGLNLNLSPRIKTTPYPDEELTLQWKPARKN